MHESHYRPTLVKVKELLQIFPETVDQSGTSKVNTSLNAHMKFIPIHTGGAFKTIQLPDDVTSGIACVRFHPTESLLSYVSSENGAITLLDGHKNFIKLSTFCCQIGGVNIPTKALEWNVSR